ncbi:MAG TPA: hypothetical protein DDW17_00535 [Deltaproteobacteria bacterium]|nr:hypothetical protein [Deltaproteobacteria bacterium]
MTYIVDTHIFIWFLNGDSRLKQKHYKLLVVPLFESQNKYKVLFLTKLPDVDNLLGINGEDTGK